MTHKHTPAPWKFFTEGNGNILCDGNSNIIGVVRPINNFGDYSESKANAHLISAAPDLLEALIEVEQMIYANELNQGTMDIVTAAIKKARGEDA